MRGGAERLKRGNLHLPIERIRPPVQQDQQSYKDKPSKGVWGSLRAFIRWGLAIMFRQLLTLIYLVGESRAYVRFWIKERNEFKKHGVNLEVGNKDVLLLCTYKSGQARDDVQELVNEAKRQGMIVVVSNNSSGISPNSADFYFERTNFGRDFGAYKEMSEILNSQTGFSSVRSVTIANDSVFYVKERLPAFVKEITNNEHDVIAVTENPEIRYHLASYFISFRGEVFRSSIIQKFWKTYRPTNLRPRNIKKGEMGLTAKIKEFVPSDQIKVLYTLSKLVEHTEPVELPSLLPSKSYRNFFNEVREIVGKKGTISNSDEFALKMRTLIAMKHLSLGSPSHFCALGFNKLGMPALKLDMIYRGVMSQIDAGLIAKELELESGQQFYDLVTSRADATLVAHGLERLLIERGLK